MSHIWTWMPNCVCSVRPLTPVPHPYNPLLILPCSVGLRPAHSVEQNAGLLISSFRADQWHWWQEPKRRLCTKWGLNKTAFLNDCLGANNPLAEWGHEVGDLGGCSSGGVRLRLRRGGGELSPWCPRWWASWTNSWEQGQTSVCRDTKLQPWKSSFRSDQARL